MVDCPRDDIRDLLPDLVHDQLEPEARVRVEQHLVDCAECAAELELLRALRATAFAAPEVDADRIAAAVRRTITNAGSDADADAADDSVVPIAAARGRGEGGADALRTTRASSRAPRRSTRGSIPQSWRIAAAIALVAAGAGGYALTRGGSAMRELQSERATVAAAPESPAPIAAPAGAPSSSAAKAGAPTPSVAAASDLAGFADSGSDAAKGTDGPLILGDAVNELSESDMQALLQSVDDLQAMPDLEPQQLPLLATVVEGAL
jgi:anti-sigma factor RsiW